MKKLLLFFLLISSTSYAQPSAKRLNSNKQPVHIIFQNTINGAALQSDSVYQNVFGEHFTIRSFKYYISNIELGYNNQLFQKIPIAPHLVNETDSTSKNLNIDVPAGNVTAIRFLLGIDSIANTSGVQTGDLDPSKGMYWIWNTGYVMAKLEGSSPASKAPGRQFSYDIGGYKKDEKAARTITLALPSAHNPQPITVIVKTDVSKWFTGVHSIKIGEQPMCHEPGKLAMQIADNYEQMFSIGLQ